MNSQEDSKRNELKFESKVPPEREGNSITPGSSHASTSTATITTEKKTSTPSTATTAALTDVSFDSTTSYWSQSQQQQQTWHFSNYGDQSMASPGPFIPPYSAALLSSSITQNTSPYQPSFTFSRTQIPLQISRNPYSPQISANSPLNESTSSHVPVGQHFESTPNLSGRKDESKAGKEGKILRTRSPEYSEKHSAGRVSYQRILPHGSKKRRSSASPQPSVKTKRSRKERKQMPPIYKNKIIFTSPHQDIDVSQLPKRLNLSPPQSLSSSTQGTPTTTSRDNKESGGARTELGMEQFRTKNLRKKKNVSEEKENMNSDSN